MVRYSNLVSLLSCFALASSSADYERISDYRKLTLIDKPSGKLILYEFEDLDRDGNVEVCISGDPERKIKVYAYFSKEHADKISGLTGVSFGTRGSYSSRNNDSLLMVADLIIMDREEQERVNYLFTLAN